MRGSSTGSNSKRFDTLHREIVGDVFFEVSGVRCSAGGGSAQPPAKKTAGLIEKETLKKRIPACHATCVGWIELLSYVSNYPS
jgi:hypothetical protein